MIMKCFFILGILERRRGGHAMKLTYFVSPFDLIDQENRTCDALSSEIVIKRKIGHSVTVCMEGSTAHKLPISSIITVNRSPTGKRFIIFFYKIYILSNLINNNSINNSYILVPRLMLH